VSYLSLHYFFSWPLEDDCYILRFNGDYSKLLGKFSIFHRPELLEHCSDEANLVKAKGWLDHCQSKHIQEQHNRHRGVRTPLKVIDSHKRRIQTASVESSYICLSYVWGSGAVARSYNACLPHDLP
jgi:hypothetical protein